MLIAFIVGWGAIERRENKGAYFSPF